VVRQDSEVVATHTPSFRNDKLYVESLMNPFFSLQAKLLHVPVFETGEQTTVTVRFRGSNRCLNSDCLEDQDVRDTCRSLALLVRKSQSNSGCKNAICVGYAPEMQVEQEAGKDKKVFVGFQWTCEKVRIFVASRNC
jgi:hypothetical protein